MQEKVEGGENVASLKNVPISPSSICLKCRVTVALSKTAGAVIWGNSLGRALMAPGGGVEWTGAYGREGASPQLLPSGTSFRQAGSAPCVLPSVEEACQGQPWYKLTHRAAPTPLGRASCLG
ncbi:hypothetical protein KOW79_011200 [Hemibagrus wyckioides]|uniref:Uncharacterized protein n=1 Tax=Hemibagrus wyckioides TaxID=337641 RepID=A0A9D3NMY6_9TELE|nr:hypothetical protein KOW79_011200 [Hemibagrus wyckioides]